MITGQQTYLENMISIFVVGANGHWISIARIKTDIQKKLIVDLQKIVAQSPQMLQLILTVGILIF